VTGLDSTETSTELATALGINNGDVINEVNGTIMVDLGSMLQVVHELSHAASDWDSIEFKVYDASAGQCVDKTITIAP
jgi:hypothetical protein